MTEMNWDMMKIKLMLSKYKEKA